MTETNATAAEELTDRLFQAVLGMIERFWYFWRVEGAPFTAKDVVETLADILAAIIEGRDTQPT
jgi:hypothetical protein